MHWAVLGGVGHPSARSKHRDRVHVAGLRRRFPEGFARLQAPFVNPAILTAHIDQLLLRIGCDRAECHELPALCKPSDQRTGTEVPDAWPVSSPQQLSLVWAEVDISPN